MEGDGDLYDLFENKFNKSLLFTIIILVRHSFVIVVSVFVFNYKIRKMSQQCSTCTQNIRNTGNILASAENINVNINYDTSKTNEAEQYSTKD